MARIPDEYRQYMSKMNDMVEGGFTFRNCPSSWSNQWGDRFYIRSYPAENYSFFTTGRAGGSNISIFSFKNNDNMSPINLQASAKLTLNITGSGSSYIGTVEHITDINIAYKGSTNYQYIDLKVNSDWSCTIYSGSSYGNISTPTNNVTLTQTGTLAEVLDYFSERLRNVDVYVNGVPWDDIVTYQWQSVPSISGKNGILSLSHVADDSILTGDALTNIGMDAVVLPSSAKFENMMANVPHGTRAPIVCAGQIDHLDAKWSAFVGGGYDLMLNMGNSSTDAYTMYQAATDASYIGFITDDENQVAKITLIAPHVEADIQTGWDLHVSSDDETTMGLVWLFIHGHTNEEDNPEINEADPGTDPTYQQDVSVTGISKPSYGAIDTGFSKMYRMSGAQLKSLSNFLWSNSFVDVVTKFFNDPREIIVGLSIMPVTPTTGSSEEVQAGGISTGVYGLPLTDQYVFDTYGFAEVKAEKGNFLDYSPFTKVTAHLPFVGEHSLDVNDVVGKQLTLKYIFDFLTGSCVAEIDVNGKPRYFFGGACGMQVPTSSEDFGRMYSSILSAGATLGGTLATIATGGLTAPLAIGAATSMLANGMNGSPTVQFSSGSGSVNGMIGCKTAFLVIEKPKEKIVGSQQKYLGRPSFMLRTLSDCSGYTKCLNVHLDNVPCTATERAEIERLLLDGVRIKTGSTTPAYTPTTASDHGLIFLKCTSDMDVIGKSWDEEHTLTVEGKLLFDQDMLTPKFVLQADTLAYNYCYIPDFGRFYYVTKQLIKTGSLTEIHLQCDVLQSWKTQILSNKAVIERSADSDNVNMYFSDNMYWTQANKEVKTVPFTKANGKELVFEIPDDNYILTIAGGS